MRDLHDRYLRGVSDLLQVIGPEDKDHLTVLTLQGRLARAIAEIRQYGPTDSARAEIARVTTELDRLCLTYTGGSFRSICGVDELPETGLPKIYHNLPQPDYDRFVGREEELAKIYDLLSPMNRHFLVTIDGIGGIGKSALALESAHRYLRDAVTLSEFERFDATVWVSAKQSVLTADGITQRKQALRTLDDIYTAINVTLGGKDITHARPDERHELIRRALTRQRTLLIVDNLETVDDEDVLTFLRELPAPTKAVVTTRHRIDVAYPIRLVGMPWDDAKMLIAQECERKSATLTDEQAHRLYNRTGGVPLALVWSIAQIGFGYDVDAVLARLGNPRRDIAQFCFEGSIEGIRGKDSHRLLMALALLKTNGDREVLGQIASLTDDVLSRDEGLVELEKLSLVSKRENQFSVLPLTKQFVTAELLNESDEVLSSLIAHLAKSGSAEANVIEAAEWVSKYKERVTEDTVVLVIDELSNWMFQYAYYGDEYIATYYSGMLEAIGGPRVVALFKSLAQQPYGGYYYLDRDCIFALGRMGHYDFLIEVLSSSNIEQIREACVDAIGLSGDPNYLPVLRDLVECENTPTITKAIEKAVVSLDN